MIFPHPQKPDSQARLRNRNEFPQRLFHSFKKALDPVVTKDS